MVFSSISFMFYYLPVVLAIYYIVPSKWRNIWLFAVNIIFYGWTEPVYILLMLFCITVTYVHGILIHNNQRNKKTARKLLISNTAINLAVLIFFKYSDMIINTLNHIPALSFLRPLKLSLPIGISFYIFQTISYAIDIYRNDAKVQKNFITFGTFVSLFPQILSGPITRYKDIASQMDSRRYSFTEFAYGIRRFAVGLAKKVLIANNIGALWNIYSVKSPGELTMLGSWMGILAFSLQLYFDFSGYSDMAVGIGHMLGFKLAENFNYPYISKSITEFWRRWHMSLGSWFRDYVYIPLGGNRKGIVKQIFNLLVVWALTGIWHGANWTFLLWGLYYAVFLILEKLFLLRAFERVPSIFTRIYTLLIVICGWVFFQLESVEQCAVYFKSMSGIGSAGFAVSSDFYYLKNYAVLFIAAIAACTPLGRYIFNKLPKPVQTIAAPLLIAAALILSTAYMVDATFTAFLYFKF